MRFQQIHELPVRKVDIFNIAKLKFRFAMSSVIATAVDYFLYLFLEAEFLEPVYANVISASAGMLINFLLQKRYIFTLQRGAYMAFLMSVLVSLGGVGLSTLIIYLLNLTTFFSEHQYLTKALAIGLVFNYNFYFKRFAFERRFLPEMQAKSKDEDE